MKKLLVLLLFAPINMAFAYDIDSIKNGFEISTSYSKSCKSILSAIKNDKADFIEPILTIPVKEFIESKKLFDNCDNSSFIEYSTILGNTHHSTTLKDIGNPEDLNSWHRPLYINLYEADLNQDGKDETIIYNACMHKEADIPDCTYSFSDFKIINPTNCSMEYGAQVTDIEEKFRPSNMVGVVQIDGVDYFYDGIYYKNENIYTFAVYGRKLRSINGKNSYTYGGICRFKTSRHNSE